MSNDITLTISNSDITALYCAVSNELCALEQSINNKEVPSTELKSALASVETYKSLLSKLSSVSPDSTYSFCETIE